MCTLERADIPLFVHRFLALNRKSKSYKYLYVRLDKDLRKGCLRHKVFFDFMDNDGQLLINATTMISTANAHR